MTLQEFVSTMIALERREALSLPPGWASIRAEHLRRMKEDAGFRVEYRACYLALTSEDEQHAKTVPPPAAEESVAEAALEEEVPLPVVERVMASFQLELPTAEVEPSVLADLDPDQTQMARLPDGPPLPFREGAKPAPPSLPIEPSPDAGETMPLAPNEELKAQVLAIRRIHEMTVDQYAALRAAVAMALEAEGSAGEQRVWEGAQLPLAADQERLRQRFFRRFQQSPGDREVFEMALRAHLRKHRSEPGEAPR